MSSTPAPQLSPEFVLTFRDLMVAKFEGEQKKTRNVIAAIPATKHDYRPDPKSRTAVEIADHIVSGETWFLNSIASGSFAWSEPQPMTSVAAILAQYDKDFAPALARVRQISAEHLLAKLDFFGMVFPNYTYLQFCHDHTVHHRGQLTTYLRAMGGKVPDVYGGSADEPFDPTSPIA